jgi:hypothetical protein
VRDVDAVVRKSFADSSWALPLTEGFVADVTRGVRRRRRMRAAGAGVVVLVVAGGATGIGVLASHDHAAKTQLPATSTPPSETSPAPSSTSIDLRYLANLRVAYVPAGLAAEGSDSYRRAFVGPSGPEAPHDPTAPDNARVELRRYVDPGHTTLVALSLLVPDRGNPKATHWLVRWAIGHGTSTPLTGVPTGDAVLVREGSRDRAVVVTTRGGVLFLEAAGRALGDGELVRMARSISWTD